MKQSRPTIKDVAKLSGVTPAIVSRVINNDKTLNIKDNTRQKILESIEELRYRPNIIAKSLRTKTSKTVAIIIPDILNPFFHQVIKGVQDFFTKQDISLMLCDTNDDTELEKKYVETLYNQQVDGILFATVNYDNDITDFLERSKINYVLVNRGSHKNKFSVKTDDLCGAETAVEHLIKLGHKKIAHISGTFSTDTAFDRLTGFRNAIIKNDLTLYPEYIMQGSYTEIDGYTNAKRLLQLPNPPTAIFAANDLMAIGVIKAVYEMNLKIPDDISVVGFNDIWVCDNLNPPLTTIRSPLFKMGHVAAELLQNVINGIEEIEKNIVLPVELVIRNSTAPPKPSK